MTLKEIKKNFSFSATDGAGACKFCAYVEYCDKILPGLIKPIKCDGPFYEFDDIDTLHESALVGDFRHVMKGGEQ